MIQTLHIERAAAGVATSGVIDRRTAAATISASTAEFAAVSKAVAKASMINQVNLIVTLDADTQVANVISIVPDPAGASLTGNPA